MEGMSESLFANVRPLSQKDSLRNWWHQVLREHGRLRCYGIILILPSDSEAIRYLKESGKELDLISGDDCLVIALTNVEFRRFGWDDKCLSIAIDDYASKGHCLQIADLMDIQFDQFPCFVLFSDIRSPDYVLTSLQDLKAEQIAKVMRSIFSIIQEAISLNQDPIIALESHRNKEELLCKGRTIVGTLSNLAGKTLETILDTWVKNALK
jgi:hypothetical protein